MRKNRNQCLFRIRMKKEKNANKVKVLFQVLTSATSTCGRQWLELKISRILNICLLTLIDYKISYRTQRVGKLCTMASS